MLGVAVSYAPAFEAAQRRPDVLVRMIDTLQARRGTVINNKLRPVPQDSVDVALAGARAAVANGQIDVARAHIATARAAMAKHPTPKQIDAEALDGAEAARLKGRLIEIAGPEGYRVVGGEPGELLKAFIAAVLSNDLVLAAAIEPALVASLAQVPAAAPAEAKDVDTGAALMMVSAALMLLGGAGMVAGRRKNAAVDTAARTQAARDWDRFENNGTVD